MHRVWGRVAALCAHAGFTIWVYNPGSLPLLSLRSPNGWTGPKEVDGHKGEGFWRAHQVPLVGVHGNPAHLQGAGAHAKEQFRHRQIACQHYAYEHGIDMPEIEQWTWPY